ncbi:hypothetical protein JHK87_052583 [Glycine soja]|nr:hypothetical protein JHK87_052583 [Glycine soja]
MLASSKKVQMTTLASACQSNLGSPNDEVRITERCLRMLPDSWVMRAKDGSSFWFYIHTRKYSHRES